MATLISSTLKLYCWTGSFNAIPTQAQYTITKKNPDSNNLIRFEIGELVQDYIDVEFNNNYNSVKTTCWWQYTKTNEYSDLLTPTTSTQYGLATKGYTYFEDGLNSTLTTSKMFTNSYLYIPPNIEYFIPVYKGPNGVANVIFYTKDSSGIESVADSKTNPTPFSGIPGTENSNDYINYVSSTVQASKIEIVSTNTSSSSYNSQTGSAIETVYPVFLDCSKYINYKISFINKFGAVQDLYFNKKRTDSFAAKRDNYTTSTIKSSSTAVLYNQYNPTSIVQDLSVKKSITLNTGFLREEYNEVMRQLFQSEDIWIREENKTVPVNIKDSSFTYKSQLNDKLVNYTVQFEYAFDGINNIR